MNKIGVFSAGCPLCEEAIERIKGVVCESCEVAVQNLNDPITAKSVREYGVKKAPAVVVNGILLPCCKCADIEIELS